jgi:anaerobic selenocysteine-containing dehydrogenase
LSGRVGVPFAKGNFPTPSKKCKFYAESLIAPGLDPLPTYVPAKPEDGSAKSGYPLMLLTSKAARHFLNLSHAGVARNLKAEGEPRLQMHKLDATPRGIQDGDMVRVRVFDSRGSMKIGAQVTDRIRPQVLSLSHGWWASRMPGGSSANALTRDGLSDLGGGGDFHDTRVQVEKLA